MSADQMARVVTTPPEHTASATQDTPALRVSPALLATLPQTVGAYRSAQEIPVGVATIGVARLHLLTPAAARRVTRAPNAIVVQRVTSCKEEFVYQRAQVIRADHMVAAPRTHRATHALVTVVTPDQPVAVALPATR